jgi:hypothetical protein
VRALEACGISCVRTTAELACSWTVLAVRGFLSLCFQLFVIDSCYANRVFHMVYSSVVRAMCAHPPVYHSLSVVLVAVWLAFASSWYNENVLIFPSLSLPRSLRIKQQIVVTIVSSARFAIIFVAMWSAVYYAFSGWFEAWFASLLFNSSAVSGHGFAGTMPLLIDSVVRCAQTTFALHVSVSLGREFIQVFFTEVCTIPSLFLVFIFVLCPI